MKAIIGFGSIWGLYTFGAMIFGSFTLGSNDTSPEIIAMLLYGLIIGPACILAIWFRRPAAICLIALFPLAAFGFIYQAILRPGPDASFGSKAISVAGDLMTAAIPGVIGILLLRSKPQESQTNGTTSNSVA
jgi:hypothetical protein